MAHVDFQFNDQFLNLDVLGDILHCVDSAMLAKASCVNTQFQAVAQEESFWESLCNKRWPSMKNLLVKSLVSSMGGFRKLYNNCFPFVLYNFSKHANYSKLDKQFSSSDFASMVEVTYNNKPVLIRLVYGVLGVKVPAGPLVDILNTTIATFEADNRMDVYANWKEENDRVVVSIQTKILFTMSILQDQRDNQFWTTLCNQMCVSWILINKMTQGMVNLAIWKPLGVIHQPFEEDFLLQFGSILPSSSTNSSIESTLSTSSTSNPLASFVHCNITMHCRMSRAPTSSGLGFVVVNVIELRMHLEDIHGVHSRGYKALTILSFATSCNKRIDEKWVANIYDNFVASQIYNQKAIIRQENRRQYVEAISCISMIVKLVSSILALSKYYPWNIYKDMFTSI